MAGLDAALQSAAAWAGLPVPVARVLALCGGLLLVASVVRVGRAAASGRVERWQRTRKLVVWWAGLGLLAAALIGGRIGVTALAALVAAVAMREFWGLQRWPKTRRSRSLLMGLLAVAAAAAAIGPSALTIGLVGFLAAVAWPAGLLWLRLGRRFDRRAAAGVLAWMVCVWPLLHLPLMYTLPPSALSEAGGGGWVLLVVITTACSDIAQAQAGRAFGRWPIAPATSPNKTWLGFVAGVVTSVAVVGLIGPQLTPVADPLYRPQMGDGLHWQWLVGPVVLGLLIAGAGLMGDLTVSAAKRSGGRKDAGDVLPGMGGVLDRVDSLLFTAPVTYYTVLATADLAARHYGFSL